MANSQPSENGSSTSPSGPSFCTKNTDSPASLAAAIRSEMRFRSASALGTHQGPKNMFCCTSTTIRAFDMRLVCLNFNPDGVPPRVFRQEAVLGLHP